MTNIERWTGPVQIALARTGDVFVWTTEGFFTARDDLGSETDFRKRLMELAVTREEVAIDFLPRLDGSKEIVAIYGGGD